MLKPKNTAVSTKNTRHSTIATLPPRLQLLTPLFLTGLSQKQIAQHTGLSYHTVRSYSKEIYARLAVSSREELVVKIRADSHPKTT